MYEAGQLLARIDDHTVPILLGFGIAMTFQTVWLVDAFLVARAESTYSLPLFCTFFWFAHDLGCVARFDEWFNVYDHWFLKIFWLGLLSALLLELLFLRQAWLYGHAELLPSRSRGEWAVLLGGGAITAVVAWELLRAIFDDPLYLGAPALTLVSYPVFGIALLVRRRSARGQTVRMWVCAAGITTFWWLTTVGYFGGEFRSWQFISAGALTLIGCVAGAVAVRRLRGAEPARPQV